MTPLVDFVIVFPILVAMTFWFDVPLSAQALLFPLFVLLALVTAFAVGLLFTVAGVRYRDVPYAIPFVIQIWMFASPVFYSDQLPREELPAARRSQPHDRRHHRPSLVVARHADALVRNRREHCDGDPPTRRRARRLP